VRFVPKLREHLKRNCEQLTKKYFFSYGQMLAFVEREP
jgi:hypothetical protein